MLQPWAAQQRGRGYAWTVWAPPSAPTALTLTKVSEAEITSRFYDSEVVPVRVPLGLCVMT